MEIKMLCTRWGFEHLPAETFLEKVKHAGYHGIDTWMPKGKRERSKFINLLKKFDLSIVSHQHQARGRNIREFCASFEYYLNIAQECEPLLINSHSGGDYFSMEEQLAVLDVAENFAAKNSIIVAHETHRGRMLYSPGNAMEIFGQRPSTRITADFSHWVCVTESYLENFQTGLQEAIVRTEHVHARIGHTQGPQVPDPRVKEWEVALNCFLDIWDRIVLQAFKENRQYLTFTPEFGPPPYLWTNPADGTALSDQWKINLFIKDLIVARYGVNNFDSEKSIVPFVL